MGLWSPCSSRWLCWCCRQPCAVWGTTASGLVWLLRRELHKKKENWFLHWFHSEKWNFVEFVCARLPLLPTQITLEWPLVTLFNWEAALLYAHWDEHSVRGKVLWACCWKEHQNSQMERANVLCKEAAACRANEAREPQITVLWENQQHFVVYRVSLLLKLLGIGLLFCLFPSAVPCNEGRYLWVSTDLFLIDLQRVKPIICLKYIHLVLNFCIAHHTIVGSLRNCFTT